MSVTYYKTRCPYCGGILGQGSHHGIMFRRRSGTSKYEACPYCERRIWNGLKPWEELNIKEKIVDIYARFYALMFYGTLIIAILAGVADAIPIAIFFGCLFVLSMVSAIVVGIMQSTISPIRGQKH